MTIQEAAQIVKRLNDTYELYNDRKPESLLALALFGAKTKSLNLSMQKCVDACQMVASYTKLKSLSQ